jgi:hypothetical protein
MIEGELLIAEGKLDPGLDELRAALVLEDALKYDEPPIVDSITTFHRCEPNGCPPLRRG